MIRLARLSWLTRSTRLTRLARAIVLAALALSPAPAVATDPPHAPPWMTQYCEDCHTAHNASGLGLTTVAGNANLCMSCHTGALGSSVPFAPSDQAVPGISGTSHRWDALAINPSYQTAIPADQEMAHRLTGFTSSQPDAVKKLTCSTCHDSHAQWAAPFDPAAPATPGLAGRHFLRAANDTNQMCRDCHRAWDQIDASLWTGAPASHPIGAAIPSGTSRFASPPRETTGRPQIETYALSGGAPVYFGQATGGTPATLVDGTKSAVWPAGGLVDLWVRLLSGANAGRICRISSNDSTTLTLADCDAPLAATIAAGDRYEIDADGNTTNDVLPGAGGQVVCMSCHGVHYADSNTGTYDSSPVGGDGMLLRRSNDDDLCIGCHVLKVHSSATTSTRYGDWGGGFGCRTCHQPHRVTNVNLVRTSIVTPNSGTRGVDFREASSGYTIHGLADASAPGSGPCEVCHTSTRNGSLVTAGLALFTAGSNVVDCAGSCGWASSVAPRWELQRAGESGWYVIAAVSDTQLTLEAPYAGPSGTSVYSAANPRYRNTGAGPGANLGDHHTALPCTTCHNHEDAFRPHSRGNLACGPCHPLGMSPNEPERTAKYHHVLETDSNLTGGVTTYPTNATPTLAAGDYDKTCTQCHADHNVFRPEINPMNSGGVAANLRVSLPVPPPSGSPPPPSPPGATYAATDGVCSSCHASEQFKERTQQKDDGEGTASTPAVSPASFAASAHGYPVTGRFSDGSTFSVTCTKCHNSDPGSPNIQYQTGVSPNRFALHDSVDRRLRAPLGIVTPADPLEERFCFRCHSRTTDVDPGGGPPKSVAGSDYYGAALMSPGAEGLYEQFQKGLSSPPRVTDTLVLKPLAEEAPSEPMPNDQAVDTPPVTNVVTDTLHFMPGVELAAVEPMPNGAPADETTYGTHTLYLRSGAEVAPAEPMPNGYLLASGGYDDTTYRIRAMTPEGGSAAETVTFATANGTGVRYDRIGQFVSPAFATPFTWNTGAQLSLVVRVSEANNANNCNLRWSLFRWTAADVQGVQLELVTDGAELPTSPTNTTYTLTTDAPVSFAAGDKLLLELEMRENAPQRAGTCSAVWGGVTDGARLVMPVTSDGNLPELVSPAPPTAGGTWVVRAMSTVAPTTPNESQSELREAVPPGTRLWRRLSVVSPPLASAGTLAAGSWTLFLFTRDVPNNSTAHARYRVMTWTAGDSPGSVLVPWTTWGTPMPPSGNTQVRVQTPPSAALALAAGDKIVVDLEIETLEVAAANNRFLQYVFGDRADARVVMPSSLSFSNPRPMAGTWAGRAMSPGASVVPFEIWDNPPATVLAGTSTFRRLSFTSPGLDAATTIPAGTWTINIWDRESSTNANATVRYKLEGWSAALDAPGPVLVDWTTDTAEMSTAALPGGLRTIDVSAPAVSLGAGDKLVLDLEIATTDVVTPGFYQLLYAYGAGAQSTLVAPAPIAFVPDGAIAGSQHRVSSRAGLHRPNPADEGRAYLSANEHVECEDCHDPHSSGSTKHALGTNDVSSVLSGVSGAVPTYSGANFTPAVGWVQATAAKEHQICYKCHSGYNQSLMAWDPGWTDVALELSPSNRSSHPVVTGLDDVSRSNATLPKALTPAQMSPSWSNVGQQTMYCSDCHGNDASAPAAQGPHGSAVDFILAGPNTRWPTRSDGVTLYDTGNADPDNAFLSGLFCLNCHPMRDNAPNSLSAWRNNNAHYRHSGALPGGSRNVACVRCHIVIPHGGAMSRLIGDRDGLMPARYAYQGDKTNIWVSSFTKNPGGPSSYTLGDCASAVATCAAHGTAATESW